MLESEVDKTFNILGAQRTLIFVSDHVTYYSSRITFDPYSLLT